ncbi:MAG: hypothetical protein F4023_11860 [Acidobacteria bacterium]|nr:hypothetical protein [Acidobacteriota bacterium]MYH50769.1 hypothetical protein [Gammaproteobacteria bacterium]MYK80335.1 hypothetical protein [Acidobacteriota bacterium]
MSARTTTPHGWSLTAIKNICTFSRGISWKKSQERRDPTPDGTPVLRIPNVQDTLRLTDLIYVDGVTQDQKKKAQVRAGCTLLVGSNGNPKRVGNCVYVAEPRNFLFASFLIGARPSGRQMHGEFLYRLLSSRPVQNDIWNSVQGSTGLRNIDLNALKSLRVLVPPLLEQRKIALILSSMDEAIGKTQAIIDQVHVVRRGLMRTLFTQGVPGKHRRSKPLLGWRFGRVASNLERIPESWALVPIVSVAKLESGHTPSRRNPEYWNGSIPWISLHDTASLDEPEIAETKHTISDLGLRNSSARLLPGGTVVFSRTATVGKSTIMAREMSTTQDFANYICGPRLHNRYLMQLFRHMQPEWRRLMAGSTHKTVYMPIFRQLQILLPPLSEQEEIANVLECLDDRIASETRQQAQLRELKAALMSVLLTGELRVTPNPEPE